MSITLRDYQRRMFDETTAAFRDGARGVLNVAPTGSGKGDMIAHGIAQCVRAEKRVMMAVHLREIALDVRARVLSELPGLPIRVDCGGDTEGPTDAGVYIGSWQTLEARELVYDIDYLIADEAHRTKAATCVSVLDRHRRARLLGFTATGQRGDGSGLGEVGYQVLIQGPQIADLVDAGHLCPVHVEAPDEFLEGLAQDPAEAMLERHAAGDSWIVYGSSIAHSHAVAEDLRRRGLRALHVDSDVSDDFRRTALEQLGSGELDVLTNYRLFVEGVNIPRCNGVVLASAFSHPGPYLQAIGRGRRMAEKKWRCRVLDLRGNMHRHLHPDADRTYHLDGRAIRPKHALSAVVNCKKCLAWFPPRPVCPMCGAKAPPPKPPKLTKRELKEQRQDRVPRVGPKWELWCAIVWEARRKNWKAQAAFVHYARQTKERPRWRMDHVPPEPKREATNAA